LALLKDLEEKIASGKKLQIFLMVSEDEEGGTRVTGAMSGETLKVAEGINSLLEKLPTLVMALRFDMEMNKIIEKKNEMPDSIQTMFKNMFGV
jgi:hypothetical protein